MHQSCMWHMNNYEHIHCVPILMSVWPHQNIKQNCWCCCQVSFAASSSSMVHGCTTSHIAEYGTAKQHRVRERQRELKHKKYQKDNSKSKITTATFNSSFPFPLAPSSDLDSHQQAAPHRKHLKNIWRPTRHPRHEHQWFVSRVSKTPSLQC